MKLKGEKDTTSFFMPFGLFDQMVKAIIRQSNFKKQDISNSEFVRECVYRYLDYLSELKEEDMIELLLNEDLPFKKDSRQPVKPVLNPGIIRGVGEIMGRIKKIAGTEHTNKRHSRSLFYNKAVSYWLDHCDKLREDRVMNKAIKVAKEKGYEKSEG